MSSSTTWKMTKPLNNETLILNLDPMNLWKWDIKNGKVENCSCRDVPFTLWTIGNWFDGEKINERECKPSWNGSFNNMVDYEKDHPFADENGLVRDIVVSAKLKKKMEKIEVTIFDEIWQKFRS
uniref:Uncharacterized protein n=1 Tax=Bursaphelenchus xylophilus TaxID=6326 RepID=A0A1I7SHK6_BURXY